MPATVSTSPSPTISDGSAELPATFVAGFRSAKTGSNYTANLRDWFAWTEITGIGPWQTQRRVVESYVGRLAANIDDLGESTWHHTLTLRAETTKGDKAAVIRPRPAHGASHQPHPRRAALRGAAAQPARTAHDHLQRRLPRQGAVPPDRRYPAHHPHSLRQAITLALDAGVGLREVQDLARHTDPKTTRGYDRSRNQLDRHATTPSPNTSPAATDAAAAAATRVAGLR